ncbi:TetR/AcrR family transcriptional regulator [Gordonia hankookensis]|uniref:TetR family transcriptional regulator n=1 Tax=Gordonia hankookensis TaxID=589403 RepID=A0ABR7WBD1_9ACTN|nr:TetR family transcriptional regulator [Gordonia hankookensis]MBD1320105.1 TetR family transcriptional regulator [Gordonia hankookensis]NDZ95263.1 TetR family transcriptional regulator [Streptomyces sp. SID11726]NEB24386.1 TetR family transcriptional regulator [Streptomyces sp. SID6673]
MPSARTSNTTFTHEARRAQLIETAIAVINDVGVERASLSRMADRAGISRGVITYHFTDRDTLLSAVVEHVYSLATDILGDRVRAAGSPRAALSIFIGGSIGFYARHAPEMAALTAIYRSPDHPRSGRGEHAAELLELESILSAGIRTGEFADCDPTIVAGTIRAGLDAALARIAVGGDAEHEKRELVALFDRATRGDT